MKSKFKKDVKYKAKATIFSPYGIIEEGTIFTGKEWQEILVYEVGNDFKALFEIIEDKNLK